MQGEGEVIDLPVNRIFRGIKVNSVYVGYEWDGIYFDAPANQVRQVFRNMGVTVGQDGDIPSQELAIGIYETDAGNKSHGQSFLTCGV